MSDDWRYHGKPAPTNQASSTTVSGHICPTCGQLHSPASDARPPSDVCECPPCPGRGNDGHGLTHCAECCFGTGVEADIDCPVHGEPHPPSDTGTTGWHRHLADHTAHLDNRCGCSHRLPVLVVDPAEARETIARTLACLEPGEDWPTNEALGGNLTGTRDDEYRDAMYEDADRVLAALAGQEQP